MITTVDVETSWQVTSTGGYDPSPFHADNILVSVGINDEYYFTNHSERVDQGCYHKIQSILDKTTLLIGHNIKFDLMWLLESGFKYTGKVYDTMLGEYILNRGIRKSLTLEMSCRRRKIGSKDSRIKEFTDRGIPFQNIPADLVEEYGRIDVAITRRLFDSQMDDLKMAKNKGLLMTLKMMNEFLVVLTDMERNGININLGDLSNVEKEYRAEFAYLKQKIDKIVYKQMGDTKINLSSPEQLSWLIYSKKPKDKNKYKDDNEKTTDILRRVIMKKLGANVKENFDNNNVVLRGINETLNKLEDKIDEKNGVKKEEIKIEKKKTFHDKFVKDLLNNTPHEGQFGEDI